MESNDRIVNYPIQLAQNQITYKAISWSAAYTLSVLAWIKGYFMEQILKKFNVIYK